MKARRYPAVALASLAIGLLLLVPGLAQPPLQAGSPDEGGAVAPEGQLDGASASSSGAYVVVDSKLVIPPPAGMDPARIAPAAAVMNETFEGAWPAPGWTVSDKSSGDGGEYFWGKRSCHPHGGSFAGWSVGGGAQGSLLDCLANYPHNARSWAVYGPIDLSHATSASLTFYFWGHTEFDSQCQFDYLFVGASTDMSQYYGARFCGLLTNGTMGNGYYRYTLSLSPSLGQPQVWLAFEFASNDAVAYEGMMIDDVTLDAVGSPLPTLTPTVTPIPTATPIPVRTPGYLPLIRKDF